MRNQDYNISDETIRLVSEEFRKLDEDPKFKAASVQISTGLETGQPVMGPAKLLWPSFGDFMKTIPFLDKPGSGVTWKRILSVVPTGSFFPGERTKGGKLTLTTDSIAVAPVTIARGFDITWESIKRAATFEDVRARINRLGLMQFLQELSIAIWGANKTALVGQSSGVGPTPVAVAAASGGALADATYTFRIVSLTSAGLHRATKVKRVPTSYKIDTSADAATLFAGSGHVGLTTESAQAQGVVSGGSGAGQVTLTWAATPGAAGYAVYGDDSTTLRLQCVVTQTKVIFTGMDLSTTIGTSNQVPGSDSTGNANSFDGVIAQLMASGSGAYKKRANSALSAAVGNQIPEISAMIQDIFDRTYAEPTSLEMGWPEQAAISKLLAGVTGDRLNLNITVGANGPQLGSAMLKSYPSPISGKEIPIRTPRENRGGMILALLDSMPYEDSAIENPWEMHFTAPIERIVYGMVDRAEDTEYAAMGALAGPATMLQGILYDIHQQDT